MTTPKPTIILTGANGGLGIGYIQNLLSSPYASTHHAIYTVRSPSTATTLSSLLSKAPENQSSTTISLDFNSLTNVRQVATSIKTRISNGELAPIHALVLNAGWQEANASTGKPQSFTEEGYEAHFGINYLSQFLFVLLLLGSMDREVGRIVMVTSFTHDSYDPRVCDGMKLYTPSSVVSKEMFGKGGTEEWARGVEYVDDGYLGGMRRYGASKLALLMFMYELQRRLDSDPALSNIGVLTVDPGAMAGTNLLRSSPPFIQFVVSMLSYLQGILVYFNPNGTWRTTYKSGTDLLLASFETKYLGEHPKAQFLDGSLKSQGSEESRDLKKQRHLWVDSLKLAGMKDGDTVLMNWE
ncbi:hypothetical protein HYFRA_00012269 [Hymenoscyphus fraxineus]|uniref:3beta-hydroxysteroid 3-dehydrogenase n=1 Tax=Hymenoscyphus fraxineus TaxID=746836 RepID=A0A9N9KYF3_9HELO|nr:hypothetical protein HYFRA_00012269 [Hymenoscyphus fraxineus]